MKATTTTDYDCSVQLSPDDAYLSCKYLLRSSSSVQLTMTRPRCAMCVYTFFYTGNRSSSAAVMKEDVDTLKNDWLTDNVGQAYFATNERYS